MGHVGNIRGFPAKLILQPFDAGASQVIVVGQLLDTNAGDLAPLGSDKNMDAGIICVAATEVKSGDLAGYRPVFAPMDGDLFEFDLLSTDSQNPAVGTPVYWVSAIKVTTTAGSNILGHIADDGHYPQAQGHQSKDASMDRGTTIKDLLGGKVVITIERSNALRLQGA